MALSNVTINVNRNGLGLVSFTKDGIMGICLTGKAVADKIELDKPYSIFSIADAEAKGITKTGDNAAAYKQIKEFYNEAGEGKKLWLIVSPETVKMSDKVSGTACAAIKLLNGANGEICAMGIVRGASSGATIVDGLNSDVWVTANELQILADNYQNKIMPFCGVIDGVGFSGDADTLKDLHTMTKHRATVVLSASESNGVASVGQFLGRMAAIPVQRKVSRVKDGELTNLEGYLTDGVLVDERMGAVETAHDKGYVVYRTFPNKAGYFFSGDPTATAVTDDLCIIARNRVIDKVIKIAYNTYIEELDDDVEVTDTGGLQPAVCAYLKSKIEQQVNANCDGEISKFVAVVDSEQNILSGLPFEIKLQITPKGYLGAIVVQLGFTNPFNS